MSQYGVATVGDKFLSSRHTSDTHFVEKHTVQSDIF